MDDVHVKRFILDHLPCNYTSTLLASGWSMKDQYMVYVPHFTGKSSGPKNVFKGSDWHRQVTHRENILILIIFLVIFNCPRSGVQPRMNHSDSPSWPWCRRDTCPRAASKIIYCHVVNVIDNYEESRLDSSLWGIEMCSLVRGASVSTICFCLIGKSLWLLDKSAKIKLIKLNFCLTSDFFFSTCQSIQTYQQAVPQRQGEVSRDR